MKNSIHRGKNSMQIHEIDNDKNLSEMGSDLLENLQISCTDILLTWLTDSAPLMQDRCTFCEWIGCLAQWHLDRPDTQKTSRSLCQFTLFGKVWCNYAFIPAHNKCSFAKVSFSIILQIFWILSEKQHILLHKQPRPNQRERIKNIFPSFVKFTRSYSWRSNFMW